MPGTGPEAAMPGTGTLTHPNPLRVPRPDLISGCGAPGQAPSPITALNLKRECGDLNLLSSRRPPGLSADGLTSFPETPEHSGWWVDGEARGKLSPLKSQGPRL